MELDVVFAGNAVNSVSAVLMPTAKGSKRTCKLPGKYWLARKTMIRKSFKQLKLIIAVCFFQFWENLQIHKFNWIFSVMKFKDFDNLRDVR